MYSAYLYQSMAAYFETKNLKGFANWMNVQAKEEMTHAMKFYRYVNERGGKVVLTAIDAPKTDWKGLIEVFADTLEHELYITSRINNLVTVATEEKDFSVFKDATAEVKVASGTIEVSDGDASQTLDVNVKFYNFPTVDQTALAEKSFAGKFYVKQESVVCGTTKVGA